MHKRSRRRRYVVDLMSEVLGMKAQEGLREEEVEKERSTIIKT